MPKFGTKIYALFIKMPYLMFGYFSARILKNYSYIWNQHPRIGLIPKFREKMKMPIFGTKNALFGYFWTRILFEINTLEFVNYEFLTHIMNFGIGSAFSKGLGSAFSEGLGPFYKVCPVQRCSWEKLFLKYAANLRKNTHALVRFQ